ncbi:hypothetical protein [Clostridium thermarum]|uniref:hypothetical protein n=1 Tax=Clostridium thermarum TaxID=1716543 RepID=UPI001123DF2A|nr:hypothetical protein [Clostridium thermarum]
MYADLICEANKLLKTFTIRYNFGDYGKDLYSSTYDELSGWIRKALKTIEERDAKGRESELYLEIKKFRGRSGDLSLSEMKHIVALLESKAS